MLRINLLPAYIAEKRKLTLAIVLAVILFLIATALPLVYSMVILAPQVAKAVQDDEDEKKLASDESAYEAATAQILAQVTPLMEKVKFVDDVQFNNRIRQRIFRNAAKFTYRKVEYDAMSVSGNTLSLDATVSSLGDIGRFYITMFNNPDVTAVSISGVPGWADYEKAKPVVIPNGPPPAPEQYRIAMNATLIKSVSAPTLPASLTGEAPAGGAPGGAAGGGAPAGPAAASGPAAAP